MFSSYFKAAFRNLTRNKGYSFLNITGFATGMAVTILISLWILDEVTYNHNFANHRKIAQVMTLQSSAGNVEVGTSVAVAAGYALATQYPSYFKNTSLCSYPFGNLVAYGEKKITLQGNIVEPAFANMFTLKMISGDRGALKDPTTILVSQSISQALFGNGSGTGKIIKLNNTHQVKIGGVYEDFPHNSAFYRSNVLLPWEFSDNHRKAQLEWNNHSTQLYVQLNDNISHEAATDKIKNVPTQHISDLHEELLLQPLDKVHLYDFENGKPIGTGIRFVWMFSVIGVFVLLLACINFMNLSTARSEKRAKEVGIRKSVGALRVQVVKQFLNESVMVALISFLFALVLVILALPYFNQIADKQTAIEWNNPVYWAIGISFTVITGILAGSYPAFYLSAFNPIKVLKGTIATGKAGLTPRRVLVVVQFTVSIALIIGTVVVFRQIDFAKSRAVGYTREGLITVPLTATVQNKFDALRNDLLATGVVDNLAATSQSPTSFRNNNSLDWRGKDPSLVQYFRDVNVTHDFGRTLQWKINQGRDFSRDHPSDSSAAIINNAALAVMGFKDPIGQVITYAGQDFTIVGVADDMVTQSPYDPLEPSVFFCSGWLASLTIRIKANTNVSEALSGVEAVFKKYDPEVPFNYAFVDDEYANKFAAEQRIGNLATVFAVFAIFISCLGLFGLASYVAEQRTKEIGIRKVLGASVFSVWQLLSKEFLMLTIVSFLIAIPVSYYFMHSWLENYQYRTTLPWWIFGAAALFSVIITLLTISFHAVRAGLTSPVKSLRLD